MGLGPWTNAFPEVGMVKMGGDQWGRYLRTCNSDSELSVGVLSQQARTSLEHHGVSHPGLSQALINEGAAG